MSNIHPTAIIHKNAKLAATVEVGAYCVVGEHVTLAEGVKLHPHVVVDGRTSIGKNTVIYSFASIGTPPQDLKFGGEPSTLEVGEHTTIREHVTINTGTEGGGMVTRVGNHCLLMVGVHIGHDCQIGNYVIMANNATIAGHVIVEDHVVIGGLSAVHQFVRIGKHAMIGGMSGIDADVIPYATAMGERAGLAGLNLVGLKRRNFEKSDIHALRNAYRILFSNEGTFEERMQDTTEQYKNNPHVMDIITFMRSESSRAITQPKSSKA